MSRPTPETDNDTQFELAAWELLKETRELARDLQDCLEVALDKIADVRRHFGDTYVWDSLVDEDIIEQCEVSLAKSKEVLG